MKFWAGQIVRGEMRGLANMSHDAAHISRGNAGRAAYSQSLLRSLLRSFLRAFRAANVRVDRRNPGVAA
jgi:hypothetical protein